MIKNSILKSKKHNERSSLNKINFHNLSKSKTILFSKLKLVFQIKLILKTINNKSLIIRTKLNNKNKEMKENKFNKWEHNKKFKKKLRKNLLLKFNPKKRFRLKPKNNKKYYKSQIFKFKNNKRTSNNKLKKNLKESLKTNQKGKYKSHYKNYSHKNHNKPFPNKRNNNFNNHLTLTKSTKNFQKCYQSINNNSGHTFNMRTKSKMIYPTVIGSFYSLKC